MTQHIILVGGGGHCKSCIDVIEKIDGLTVMGVLDLPQTLGRSVLGYPVIGTDDDTTALMATCRRLLVTVGQIASPDTRIRLFRRLERMGADLTPVVSPTAIVSGRAGIGAGTVVLHRATVNAGARIGKNCIINTGAIIEHDVEIGDHCHISTGAIVNGETTIGEGSFVGSGAVVHNCRRIGKGAVIAAGALVRRDVPDGGRQL